MIVADYVKARLVAGSLVATLTKPILEHVGIEPGDRLLVTVTGPNTLTIERVSLPVNGKGKADAR